MLDKVYISAAETAYALYTYGSVIPKNWLVSQFCLTQPSHGSKKDFDEFAFEFLQNIEGFKSEMLKSYKMHLESVRGVGYRIVLPKEQTDVAMSRLKDKVSTEIRKAVDVLQNVNENLLELDDLRKRDESIGKIAALSAFQKRRISS